MHCIYCAKTSFRPIFSFCCDVKKANHFVFRSCVNSNRRNIVKALLIDFLMDSLSSLSQKRTRTSDEKRNAYLRRFQLLRHQQIARLCDVMETVVPIHGTGNFPTLDIKPSRLVQVSLKSVKVTVKCFCRDKVG